MIGTRLVLVRHGHSVAQELGLVAGHAGCRGLSERGRREVDALAARLARTGELGTVDVVLTSRMARAAETGDVLAAALGDPPVHRDCDWCEFHMNDEDGRTWADVLDETPWPDGPVPEDFRSTPTAESWAEMAVRVRQAIERIVDEHAGRTVLVTTHGGTITNAMVHLLRLSSRPHHDGRAHLEATNTGITEFVMADPGRLAGSRVDWRLERWNDAAHLADVT